MQARPVALGLRAAKGGGVVVAVALDGDLPRLVLSGFVATAADGDRLSLEPYRVAAEMGGGSAAEEAARGGRARQARLALEGLDAVVGRLREAGHAPSLAALLVNRAGWVTDLLAYSLAWQEHVPVAEGLAVRDAFRQALGQLGLEVAETDERSLPERASEALGLAAADIDARLKTLGAAAGRPWRREQKLACLAAWVAVRTRRRAAPQTC